MQKTIEEQSIHFIDFFQEHSLIVIEQTRATENYNWEELFEKVTELLKNKVL